MMPPMYGGYGKGKGKSSPQLNVDASKKLWIGNIPEQATWRDLQTLEQFRYKQIDTCLEDSTSAEEDEVQLTAVDAQTWLAFASSFPPSSC
eukprot:s381_g5.t1